VDPKNDFNVYTCYTKVQYLKSKFFSFFLSTLIPDFLSFYLLLDLPYPKDELPTTSKLCQALLLHSVPTPTQTILGFIPENCTVAGGKLYQGLLPSLEIKSTLHPP
jgi:hypothetical protein